MSGELANNLSKGVDNSIELIELTLKLVSSDNFEKVESKRLAKMLKTVNSVILSLLKEKRNGDKKVTELFSKALEIRKTILKEIGRRVNGEYLIDPVTLMTLVDICNILFKGIEEGKISLKEWINSAIEGFVDDDPMPKVNVDIIKCISMMSSII